jgi:bifunctional DNA-binding transcriptional regulator/antitoxin component of YhaV-PrlF toxin-antitoxin module
MDIFIKLDEHGRMTIPNKIRKKYKTRNFILEERQTEVVLKPVMSIEQLFGTLPDVNIEKLKEEHIKEVEYEDKPEDEKEDNG